MLKKLMGVILGVILTIIMGIPMVHAQSKPQVGLMLDSARMYQSPTVLKQYIDMLATQHGTYLQLHLTDNENFGVESTTLKQTPTQNSYHHGEIYYNRWTKKPYLTKAQLQQVIDYGHQKGITVIPEIDIPGHSQALIQQLKRIHTQNIKSLVNPYSPTDELNYHRASVVKWVQSLLNEYIPLLPTQSYLATGGDENTVTDKSDERAIVKFENQLNRFLNQHQLQMQLWNDNVHQQNLHQWSKNIRITYWSQSGENDNVKTNRFNLKKRASLSQINHAGLKTINANAYYLYLLANHNQLDNLATKSFKTTIKSFTPQMENSKSHNTINPSHLNQGIMLSVWGDNTISQDNLIYQKIIPLWQGLIHRLTQIQYIQ